MPTNTPVDPSLPDSNDAFSHEFASKVFGLEELLSSDIPDDVRVELKELANELQQELGQELRRIHRENALLELQNGLLLEFSESQQKKFKRLLEHLATEPIKTLAGLAAPFRSVTDAGTLATVLNMALPLHLGRHPKATDKRVTLRVLNYYAFKNKDTRYRTFEIPKRSRGEMRTIHAPNHGLLRIQRLLALCLTAAFTTCDNAAHGFVVGRSILTNAQQHVGRRFVLNLDLKDFFPSTHIGRVVAILQLEPFRLPKKAAFLISNLCCDQGVLPQGAPTSPLLTNAVCQRLDRQLRQLASRFRCRYTRYADDLTFSSNRPAFTQEFHSALNEIITGQGYEQNLKKQRLQNADTRQEVTGLIVNEKANVPREYYRQIRAMLHNWSTLGYQAATAKLRMHYQISKAGARHAGSTPPLERVLAGKISYLGMVRGKEDAGYIRLLEEFAQLADFDYADLAEAVTLMEQIDKLNSTQLTRLQHGS